MLQIAQSQFGCSPGDAVCYCTNPNFGFGIRDCVNEACSPDQAARVIAFGTEFRNVDALASSSALESATTATSNGPATTTVATTTAASETTGASETSSATSSAT
ncbi:uncharacterized protein EI97DRAFT_436584 [Westerdykella ornata]|uniref:CFEM domain-containing protein n=1 Tax=Westerdykella ornata TaxID=318751 RepID=A0A6A6JA19_WESOR|nr:uncharacterized protein EI97DRAFT_436584 [Westerdykella ornata]KAF2272808.1 hypothetical protein EI97DRAFT_436584 [Westerdykella ornata]